MYENKDLMSMEIVYIQRSTWSWICFQRFLSAPLGSMISFPILQILGKTSYLCQALNIFTKALRIIIQFCSANFAPIRSDPRTSIIFLLIIASLGSLVVDSVLLIMFETMQPFTLTLFDRTSPNVIRQQCISKQNNDRYPECYFR